MVKTAEPASFDTVRETIRTNHYQSLKSPYTRRRSLINKQMPWRARGRRRGAPAARESPILAGVAGRSNAEAGRRGWRDMMAVAVLGGALEVITFKMDF